MIFPAPGSSTRFRGRAVTHCQGSPASDARASLRGIKAEAKTHRATLIRHRRKNHCQMIGAGVAPPSPSEPPKFRAGSGARRPHRIEIPACTTGGVYQQVSGSVGRRGVNPWPGLTWIGSVPKPRGCRRQFRTCPGPRGSGWNPPPPPDHQQADCLLDP